MPGILFATHGGATADGACHVATLLAKRLATTVRALCVVETLPVLDRALSALYLPTAEEWEAPRDMLRVSASQQLRRCGTSVTPDVVVGPVAYEIATAARRSDAELIVVGFGRHGLVDRALGGETALQLAQLASTPVLAVPQAVTSLPRNVVAAIDFSPTSVASAQTCAGWLTGGDVLTLVHATGRSHESLPLTDRVTLEGLLEAIAGRMCVADGVTVKHTVLEGEPATQLLSIASSEGVDLLVLGSHGYGLWKRLTIGSVASKLLRLSAVSVLVTPIGSLASTGTAAGNSSARVASA
jgi:nucleotide-binding universal stress UspA family protein